VNFLRISGANVTFEIFLKDESPTATPCTLNWNICLFVMDRRRTNKSS